VWALNKRKPWFHLFFDAARGFFPPPLVGVPKHKRPAPWLNPAFVKRNRSALLGYETKLKLFGPRPTFQESISALQVLQRQLACDALSPDLAREKRYPYLDRSLLEFMYAVPREQLVRPGHRRSLMRRALVGIVPDELLNRKRKAYVSRGPMAEIATEWTRYADIAKPMVSSSLGIVEVKKFLEALQKARHGKDARVVILLRTLGIEKWLQKLEDSKVLKFAAWAEGDGSFAQEAAALPYKGWKAQQN
jgi:asparagine synthase (glutamine-hydrolysing)